MLRNHLVNYRASWQRAREQYAALTSERVALLQERNELRAVLRELQAAVQARWAAEERLADLYRERAIVRARAAERDPAQPLH